MAGTDQTSKDFIQIIDLRKSYGDNHVLRGVDMVVSRGETTVIIGGSGAGKTVLLKHVIGLEKPDSGQVIVDGEDITVMNDVALGRVRRKFGMVFQFGALFDSMSLFDNVAFPLREHAHLKPREIRERVMNMLRLLGLDDAWNRFPGDLSGGMRKRGGVARALIMEPGILIYDEPTTGLDPLAARNVDQLIVETAARFKVTSLVITHDMTTCFGVGQKVNVLYEGRIAFTGAPADLAVSSEPVVRQFLGSSGVSMDRVKPLIASS